MQTLAALLTPTIALVAAMVAFLQWRTAHQRVILDLFDKRLAIIDAARKTARDIVTKKTDFEAAREIAAEAAIRSRFLFGSDIVKMLVEYQGDIFRATEMGGLTETTSDEERIAIAQDSARSILKNLNTLAEPYLRLDQKRVRTPTEWLRDRNRLRKSFADGKEPRY